MDNANIEWAAMSDKAIIATIGEYLKHQRLAKNKTQAQIAVDAGINRWTLSNIENGKAVTLASLVQILRALDLLSTLNIFRIEKRISPIELAKSEKQKRRRARNVNNDNKTESEW
ncbi:MAG: helix-turn-helix transcriptional regulator [Candidatus Cloacimonetes bacterium]|jgi:transcriptional regulator with XRE-family HTH domain|nr:helix-turn-helix transcriptional regulator [Candidatus Cloacimonadota bacterium]